MNCTICGKKILLIPSAEERARNDVTGKTAAYYTSIFTEHPDCTIQKRAAEVRALVQRISDESKHREVRYPLIIR
jgi:hypothetical protein